VNNEKGIMPLACPVDQAVITKKIINNEIFSSPPLFSGGDFE